MNLMRAALFLVSAGLVWAADWPQWRGPQGNGVSEEKDVPVDWRIEWKAPLPGLGTSTPIVWGDRIFLTSQIGDGPFESRGRDFAESVAAKRAGARKQVEFAVQAFARADGKLLWERRVAAEGPLPPVHMKHNLASPSCVTDGELVFAWFGTGQVLAFTLDGKPVWNRHLGRDYGPFEILWGHGSSPALYKDMLLLLCDHQGSAYLLAADKRTGKTRWKAGRGSDRRSYTTPYVASGPRGDELIVNSSERIDALDPNTGELLWYVGEPNRVPVPTPVSHNGILYASRGYSSSPYLAVRLGGRGDVSQSQVVWQNPTGGPYVSSLLYYEGLLYMAAETGVASCVDAETGQVLWKERLGGVFSASPVAAGGRIYLVNEQGEGFVLQAGRRFKLLRKNSIGERTLASPAISAGRVFLRTDDHLIAMGGA